MAGLNNIGNIAGQTGSLVNFFANIVTGTIAWAIALPMFIKALFGLMVLFTIYIIWEFKGKILTRPKQIEV